MTRRNPAVPSRCRNLFPRGSQRCFYPGVSLLQPAPFLRESVAKRFRFPIHLANGKDFVYFSKVFFRRKGCFLARPTAVTRSHQDSLRHRIEEIRKEGEALVDTIFDDPYYCGALDHLREDFTAYRYTEFFRRFYKAGDEKAAGRCLLKAVAARPGTMFKIDYWIKLVRLHARRVALPNLGRSVSNTLESVAKYILDAGPRPFVLLISLAFSAFFHLTAKGQTAGFSLRPLPSSCTLFEGRRPGYERFSLQRKGEPAESRRQVPSVSCRPSVGIRVLRTEREPLPDPDLSPVLWVVLLDVSDKEGSCLRGPAKTASGMRLGDACHPPQSDILTQLGRGFSKFLSPVGGMEGERGHCKTPLFELSCRAHPYDRGRRIRECLP